ncbi:conserved hypothetical protein [Ricinus communis]|uniref:Uncharacterized protein n=1 Tax=Ricinus communis TaxID=3988 RepID=B9RLZ2_RICCO|nr:conserved hypothetical protein [Ricinus communis]
MANDSQYHLDSNARRNARGDVARHSITNPACSSARNAVRSAYAFLLGTTGTKVCALATTTGRPNVEDPNALRINSFIPFFLYLGAVGNSH